MRPIVVPARPYRVRIGSRLLGERYRANKQNQYWIVYLLQTKKRFVLKDVKTVEVRQLENRRLQL